MSLHNHYSNDAVGLEFVRKRWRVPDRDQQEYPQFLSLIRKLREEKIKSLTAQNLALYEAAERVDSSYIKIALTDSRTKYIIYPEGLADIDAAMKALFPDRRSNLQVPRRDHHQRVSRLPSGGPSRS